MADVRITLYDSAFTEMNADSGMVGRAAAKLAGSVRDRAKGIITSEGRVDTGKLLQSVVSEKVRQDSGGVIYQVGSNLEYAIYQHEGVQGPIVPRRARVLRFRPGGANAFIFRPRVSGFEGIEFLTKALEQTSSSDAL